MQFVSLSVGGGIKLSMSYGHRAKAGDCRNQRLFLCGENSFRTWIDQDSALSLGGAEGRRDQHPGRNQASQRVNVSADGEGNGFSGGDCALCQICSKTNGLPIMAGTRRMSKLRSFGGDGTEFKRTVTTEQNAHQATAQKEAQLVGQGLDYRGHIGRPVKSLGDVSQQFSTAMLLPGGLAQP